MGYSWPTWLPAGSTPEHGWELNMAFPLFSVPHKNKMSKSDIEVHFTPIMEQYWKAKEQHQDKVVLLEKGWKYEAYYHDAFILSQICGYGSGYKDGRKPCAFFPVSDEILSQVKRKLIGNNISVAVVAQIETPKEAELRSGKKSVMVQREVRSVCTPGVGCEDDDAENTPNIGTDFPLISVASGEADQLAIACGKIRQARFALAEAPDTKNIDAWLRTLLVQLQPREVVLCATDVNLASIRRTVNQLCPSAHISLASVTAETCSMSHMMSMVKRESNTSSKDIVSFLGRSLASRCAVGLLTSYLQKCLMSYLLSATFCDWQFLGSAQLGTSKHLLMDSSCLTQLDILHPQQLCKGNSKSISLFSSVVNHCVTLPGHARLREWMTAPLMVASEIEERMDCAEFFLVRKGLSESLRAALKKGCQAGVRRALVWVAAASERRCDRDAIQRAAMQLRKALEGMVILCEGVIKSLRGENGLPVTLAALVKEDPEEAIQICKECLSQLVVAVDKDGCAKKVVFAKGSFVEYDAAVAGVDVILGSLEKEKQSMQTQLGLESGTLKYVHQKGRFELEIPEAAVDPAFRASTNITSLRKGYVRCRTAKIDDLVAALAEAEENVSQSFSAALRAFAARLTPHIWELNRITSVVATVDALSSLAIAAERIASVGSLKSSRACFRSGTPNGHCILDFKGCWHPVIATQPMKGGQRYVPNDIHLGTQGKDSTLVITGPNMGGKTSLMRTVCMVVVLAQVGCPRVPAESCTLTPVDRIFTRIGIPSDWSSLEGRSAFEVEMAETACILNEATPSSLVCIDELGRGTSTCDGAAIAWASLNTIASRTRCRCLFTTHYTALLSQCSNDNSLVGSRVCHMAVDTASLENQQVVYLYTLCDGVCAESRGLEVARLAGLTNELILAAKKKALEVSMTSKHQLKLDLTDVEADRFQVARSILNAAKANDGGVMLRNLFRWLTR
eukprot:gnl/MRDRNA2_/MRDRNA2_158148_c0_seq1.p1 gnl/MRDRNA2_/MRDRNA2_158148_c0~~gnl/MRDRNA2_/MRDRNA2_158148_c0_seq1.p1  ORF type:complete len:1082 (+),score=204.17 gnl/MRDRNA2_/MRDRNA2_158148_c0_seq1:358-3246(+)